MPELHSGSIELWQTERNYKWHFIVRCKFQVHATYNGGIISACIESAPMKTVLETQIQVLTSHKKFSFMKTSACLYPPVLRCSYHLGMRLTLHVGVELRMQCNNTLGIATETCMKCGFNEPVNYYEVGLVLVYTILCREYPRQAKI